MTACNSADRQQVLLGSKQARTSGAAIHLCGQEALYPAPGSKLQALRPPGQASNHSRAQH